MSEPQAREGPRRQSSSRYRLNLALFVLFLILLTFWFYRHLQLYVTEVLLLGGSMTLWAAWQIVQSWLRWGWEDEAKELNRRLLSHARTTEYLLFGFFLLAVLWSTTSSVYVVYEGETRGQPAFKVEVLHKGQLFLKPLNVTSYDRTAGRPFFLRWQTLDLDFRIVDPYGYESHAERLAPWSSIYLRVPADFSSKRFRVLRFVPLALYQVLPPVGVSNPTVSYSLRLLRAVTCDAESSAGGELQLKDLRRQALYIGGTETDLRWLLEKRDAEKFQKEFTNDLAQLIHLAEEKRAEWIREWEATPRLEPGPLFSEGEAVCLQIWRRSETHAQKLLQLNATLSFPESFCKVYLSGEP